MLPTTRTTRRPTELCPGHSSSLQPLASYRWDTVLAARRLPASHWHIPLACHARASGPPAASTTCRWYTYIFRVRAVSCRLYSPISSTLTFDICTCTMYPNVQRTLSSMTAAAPLLLLPSSERSATAIKRAAGPWVEHGSREPHRNTPILQNHKLQLHSGIPHL